MFQDADGFAYDEKAYPKAVGVRRIDACERLENARHLVSCDADSVVIHVNTDLVAGVTAAQKNSATGLGVLDGIADQVAQDSTEKQCIALNRCARGYYSKLDSPFQGHILVFVAGSPQQWCNPHGRELDLLGVLAKPKRSEQLVELIVQAINGVLAGTQEAQLGVGSNAEPEALVSALYGLKRLPQVVSGYGK